MKKQTGAALIVVLSLLLGALVIGLSSMQSSLVDERLAGNQKLASEVQMAAEEAAAIGLERFRDISSMTGISAGEPASVLFGILMSDECSVDDLFLAPAVSREEIGSPNINSAVPSWESVLDEAIDNNVPCPSYIGWPAGETNYAEPEFSSKFSLLKNDMSGLCDAPIICSYRYVRVGYNSTPHVVGVAHFEEGGQVLAEGRPVFLELELSDPPSNLSWLFDAPPITLLSYIENLSVNGANNLTLNGVDGVDILAHSDNYQVLYDGFLDANNNKVNFEPEIGDVDAIANPLTLSDLIPIIQTIKTLSEQGSPGITYVTESPDMDAVEDGVLVVADNFSWVGTHDFKGTIIVLGSSATYNGMGQSEFLGSFIHAPIKLNEPNYDQLPEDEFVDFSKVDEFQAEDWRYLDSGDTTQGSFDFNGLGKALLENNSDVLIGVSDNVFGELTDAKILTWEQD